MGTRIEYVDLTLNPIVGCSKCSHGCDNCYAEKFAARMANNPATAKKYAGVVDEKGWTGKISKLDMSCFDRLPKKPSRIFVGSMTDFFHENANFDEQGKVLAKIANTPQHTFLLLTKRPDIAYRRYHTKLPNVWLGVTVCNQEEADEKLPILMEIPAEKRFVSVEPMLGPVDLFSYLDMDERYYVDGFMDYRPLLHWVICGGETGPKARPMHPDWIKDLRDQCESACVPFFFKSWGEWLPCTQISDDFDYSKYPVGDIGNDGIFIPPPALEVPWRNMACGEQTFKVGKKLSGYLIDGEEYREFPE